MLLLLSLLLTSVTGQARHVSRVVLERHEDACTGLEPAQCCTQMLEIAGFRATGDQLPRAAKTPLRLSCETPAKVFPETSCRLLAMARGFPAKQTSALCEPANLAKRCSDDASCKQCVDDLGRLAWKGSHRACYAVTHVERTNRGGTKVVTLTHGKDSNGQSGSAADGGNVIRVRRTTLR